MLDERRVRRMAKLASYESKEGKEDIEISLYFKKDYVSLNILKTLMWVTVGYLLVVALVGLVFMETLIEAFSIPMMIGIGVGVVAGYIIIFVCYRILARRFYRRRHGEARERVKRYCHGLFLLEKLYEKENVE